jgi:nucleoside 2-deoxyribosyltransferase
MKKTKTICLCGSSRFVDVFAVVAWVLERDEHVITTGLHLLPWWYGAEDHHQAEAEGVSDSFNELHLRKIDQADEIFVVNCRNYIGDDTRREIAYAQEHGKPIRFYMTDPVGNAVAEIARQAYDKELVAPPCG